MEVLLLLVACRTEEAPPVEPAGPEVALWVDDVRVGAWPVGGGVELADALPPGSPAPDAWKRVEATSGPRTLRLTDPATTWAGADIVLTVDGAGRPGLAVVREPDPDLPAAVRAVAGKPLASLDGIESVHVWTTLPEPPPAPEGALLVRVPGGGPASVTPTDLGEPTGERKQEGWALGEVVAKVADPAAIAAVDLIAGTETIRVPAEELASQDVRHVLKLNKEGDWVYRAFRGDGRAPEREVRGVERLEIVPR